MAGAVTEWAIDDLFRAVAARFPRDTFDDLVLAIGDAGAAAV